MFKDLIQNISLRLRIIIVGLLLFTFMLIYNIFTLNNLHKIRVGVKQTEKYIIEYNEDISRIESLLNNTLLRFYVFTRQKISYVDFYNYYRANVDEIGRLISDLERRVENYQEYVLVNKLKSSFKLFNDIGLEIIRAYKLHDTEAIDKLLVSINDVYKSTREALRGVQDFVISKEHNRYVLLQSSVRKIQNTLFFVDLLLVIGGLFFIAMMYTTFVEGFYRISQTVEKLSQGRIPSELPEDKSDIGIISHRLNLIIRSRKLLHEILENLRSENYDAIDYEVVKEEDIVYTSLRNLAIQLHQAKQLQIERLKEEEHRRWITEGLNLFSEVMRSTSNDLQLLGDAVIKNLVKYLDASVGGLYIVNEVNPEDVHLELLSVFAYDRKKFYTKRVEFGEGLIGSVAVDQTIINLTNIPDDYIEIESGLGDSKPNNLLIVPLKTDRGLHGVYEIAAFHEFEKYELEFAEQVASSIAATLEAVKVNARTVQLLEETRQKSEELAKREQELRRLYDQMQTARQEAEARAAEMSSILNAVSQVLLRVEVDPEGIVTTVNESFLRTLKVSRNQVTGEHFKLILPTDQENLDQIILKKLHALQIYKDTFHYKVGDQDVWLLVTFAPILGPNDELIRILWLSIDITEQKEIELRNAKLLEESIKKSEELMKAHQIVKRNEVELKSILEGIDQTLLRAEYSVEGILLFANEKHRNTLGYNYEDVLGKSIFIFIPEEEKEEFAKLWEEVAGGALKQVQVKRKTATGQDLWLLNQYTPIRDEQGNITKILYLAIDVTEQVEAEQRAKKALEESHNIQKELLEKETELRSILEGIDRAILRAEYTPEGILTFANELHRQTFGYNYEEVLGKSIFIFIPDDEKEDFAKLWEAVASGEMMQVRVRRFTVTGEELWLLNQYTPVIDPNTGKVTKILYLAQNITEQVHAELEAKKALEESQKIQRELQEKETELRSILEGIDRAILRAEFTPDGILTYANELHRRTFGYKYEEILGKSIFIFIPDEEKEEFEQLWKEVVENGEMKRIRVRRYAVTGEEVWLLNQYTPVIDPNTHTVSKVLYLAQDITDQVKAELEAKEALERAKRQEKQLLSFQQVLQKAEAERRAILEGIDRVILRAEYSVEGTLLFANELHRKTLGYNYEEALGKSIFQFIPEEEKEEFKKIWEEVAKGKSLQMRVRRLTADGQEIWLLNQYTPVFDTDGNVYKVLYLAQDITDQVHAEREAKKALNEALKREAEAIKLQREREQYQLHIENLLSAIDSIVYRVGFDLDGNLIQASDNLLKFLGIDSVQGLTYRDLLSEENIQSFEEAFNKAKNGEYVRQRIKYTLEQEQSIWFLSAFAPIYEEDKIISIVVLNIDITDQIEKEKKIESLLQEVMERELEQEAVLFAIDSTMLRALYSVEGNLLNANQKHVETLGYDLEKARGQNILQFVPEDDREEFEQLWKEVVSGKPKQILAERTRKDTGQTIWLLNQYTPIFDEVGNVQKVLYLALDFTEFKQLEEKILARERELIYLRQGIDSSLLRAEYTADGILLDANELHQKTLGYDLEKMRGKSILEFVPEVEREKFTQFWEKIKAGESFEVAVHRQRKDTGEDLWLLNHYIPVKDDDGNVVRIIYLATDITKQRQTEARYISLFQGIDSLVLRAEYAPDGTLLDANQMHQHIIGYDLEQMRGKKIFEFIQPEEKGQFEQLWKKVIAGQPQSLTVLRYRKDTGEQVWLLNNYLPIKDINGEVVSILYIGIDITREKEAQTEFAQVQQGIDRWFLRAEYTPEGLLVTANTNHQEIIGYNLSDYVGKSILEFVPEQERTEFEQMWQQIAQGKFVQKAVRRQRADNGQTIWLLNHYLPLTDAQGNVVRVIYLAIDITEQKQLEEALSYLLQGVDRTLLHAEYDTEGKLISSNKLHQQVLGYNLNDYIGRNILEFVPEQERTEFKERIWANVIKGNMYQVVVRRERKDTGQEIWLLNQYIPVTDDKGDIVRVIYLAVDITEQKQLEKRLYYLTLGIDQTLLRAEYTPEGALLEANDLHQKVLGYDLEKFRGKNILEFIPAEELEEFKKIWEKVQNGEKFQVVVKRERKDTGEQLWLLNQYIPIVDARGNVESIIYLAIDITEYRKSYEQTGQLKGEIEALSYAVDATMLRAEYSPDGILLDANERHTKVLGYDLEKMKGKNILEFIPEEEREQFQKIWDKVRAGEPHQMVVKRKNMETGEDVWLVNQYTPVFDKQGNVVKIIYLAIDITDRKFNDNLSGSGNNFDSDIDRQINDWLDDIS